MLRHFLPTSFYLRVNFLFLVHNIVPQLRWLDMPFSSPSVLGALTPSDAPSQIACCLAVAAMFGCLSALIFISGIVRSIVHPLYECRRLYKKSPTRTYCNHGPLFSSCHCSVLMIVARLVISKVHIKRELTNLDANLAGITLIARCDKWLTVAYAACALYLLSSILHILHLRWHNPPHGNTINSF